jgi:5'-deoxynucleotidase YfbR-like HD superfamily hydrolase
VTLIDAPPTQAIMRTYWTKKTIDLCQPREEDITLMDIAWGLARINRFNGHTIHPYSVGEHSMAVSQYIWNATQDRQLALAGLLHDASEAYVGDLNGNLKQTSTFYGFRLLEDLWAHTIERRFKLPLDSLRDPVVKEADKAAFLWECAMVRDASYRKASDPNEVTNEFTAMARDLGVKG